jgi:hypothetical protein
VLELGEVLIEGTVRRGGKPVSARIVVTSYDGEYRRDTSSDRSGEFSFDDLPGPGTYVLAGKDDGGDEFEIEVVIPEGTYEVRRDIDLGLPRPGETER